MARRYSVLATMIYSRLQNRGRLVCALLATTLTPGAAFADHDNGKGNKGEKDDKGDNGKGKDRGDKDIPVVPEANAGWVLVPFFGAVLLFSSRQFLSTKLGQKIMAIQFMPPREFALR